MVGTTDGKVPVDGGSIERRLVVGIVFLDGCLEGFLEWYIVGDVPAIHGYVPAVILADSLIVVGVLEEGRIAPRIAKVILGAGTECGGKFFTIDEKLLISFPPPSASGVPYMEHNTAVTPPALCLEHCPVDCSALRLYGQKRITMPFGMEAAKLFDWA